MPPTMFRSASRTTNFTGCSSAGPRRTSLNASNPRTTIASSAGVTRLSISSSWPSFISRRGFAASGQRSHVDDEPVANIALHHTLESLVDVGNVDHLDIRRDAVLGAIVQHLLGLWNAADARRRQAASLAHQRADL